MVYKKVAKILAEIIDTEYEDITPDTELTGESGIEAINLARLVIQCEKQFKVIICDEDVHNLKCVIDIVNYIENSLFDK